MQIWQTEQGENDALNRHGIELNFHPAGNIFRSPKPKTSPQPLSNGLGHSIVSRPVNWLILCMSTKMNAVLCSVPWPIENPFRLEFHCVRQSPMQMPHLYKVTIDDDLRSPLKLK